MLQTDRSFPKEQKIQEISKLTPNSFSYLALFTAQMTKVLRFMYTKCVGCKILEVTIHVTFLAYILPPESHLSLTIPLVF